VSKIKKFKDFNNYDTDIRSYCCYCCRDTRFAVASADWLSTFTESTSLNWSPNITSTTIPVPNVVQIHPWGLVGKWVKLYLFGLTCRSDYVMDIHS